MELKDLYCLGFAPIQGTGLDSLNTEDTNDISIEEITKEIGYLRKFCNVGLDCFTQNLNTMNSDQKDTDGATALFCMISFLNRLQSMVLKASTLTGEYLQIDFPDTTDTFKSLSKEAKENGIIPKIEEINEMFDCEKDAEWETPNQARGKVLFRPSVSVIKQCQDDEKNEPVEFSTTHQPIKSEFERKKGRQATGYAKFKFKDQDDDSGNENLTNKTKTNFKKENEKKKKTYQIKETPLLKKIMK